MTWSCSSQLGVSGYSECKNGHAVHWWAANGKAPKRCDECGKRLRRKETPMTMTVDEGELKP